VRVRAGSRTLVGTAIALGLVVQLAAVPAAGAATSGVRVSFSRDVLAGEQAKIKIDAGVPGRPVELQVLSGSGWRRVAAAKTGTSGKHGFYVTVGASARHYRIVAEEFRAGGRRYPRAHTDTVTVAARTPTARLQLGVAPIAQSPTGTRDLTVATASFSPARPGAAVRIQRRAGSAWTDVPGARGVQDAHGSASIPVVAATSSGASTFRAVSTPAHTAAIVSPAAQSATWQLTWSEEFNAPDQQMALRPSGYVAPRTCSRTDATQTTVSQGVARLTVAADPTGPPSTCSPSPGVDPIGVLNAAVHTQSTAFTYGVFAARIKYPAAAGKHGAFWMMPAKIGRTGDPAQDGAEIDVNESFGDDAWGMQSNVYWNTLDANGNPVQNRANYTMSTKDRDAILGTGKPSTGYHVYSVEWTPTQYVFRVDGVETFRTSQGVSHAPERIILSLLASDWELRWLDPTTVAKDHMDVDWVRVWQQQPR
jgi:beta-glucanase (GH16 family)